MTPRILTLILPFIILLSAGAAAQPVEISPLLQTIEPSLQGKIIVKVKPELYGREIPTSTFGEAAKRFGIIAVEPWIEPKLLWYGAPSYKPSGRESPEMSLARIMVVSYSSLDAPERVAEVIGRMKGVEYAEPIVARMAQYTPNDLELVKQTYLDAIHAKEAWDLARADSTIIIAITDTGIERLHRDLKDAIWYNAAENGPGPNGDKSSDNIDNDGNGFVDDWWGWDFAGQIGADQDNDPSGKGEEHGTEVAGVAGAVGNNTEGIAGIGFGAKLMAVKVGDDRAYPNNRIYNGAKGILYAATMGAKIINCSWGGSNPSRSEAEVVRHVVDDMHALVVAAAGNDSDELDYYPASYPGVLNVGALTAGGDKASFSNYSYRVDLSAPGVDIFTTVFNSAYSYDRGTSFATPMVSGVAALLTKRYPDYDAEKIAEIIRATTDDIGGTLSGLYAGKMGSGLLNARRAVEEGGTIASARMVEYTLNEAIPDGAADAGEIVRIEANIKNILADASAVTATLTPITDPTIAIKGPTLALGAMASGESRVSPDSVFEFIIPPSTSPNTPLVFKLTVTTQDRANDQYITIHAMPTWLTTDHNDIVATFNSTGNIGHNGLSQKEGDGISYAGSDDLLYHGGLMIGTDAQHVADVVRMGRTSEGVNDGFHMTKPYRLHLSQDSSVEIGAAAFNDAHLPEEMRVGVDVEMTTYEYASPSASNILLMVYKITNRNATTLSGLRCGLYLDFDISSTSYDDQVRYDAPHRLGFQRSTSGTSDNPFVGITLASQQDVSFWAVNNDQDSVLSAFYLGRKWAMMSSGIHENTGIDDMAIVMSGGPVTLASNGYTEVAFALVASYDFDSLRAAADRARTLFTPSGVAGPAMPGSFAAIAQPNPFGAMTRVEAEIPETGATSVVIYNLQGERVATLFDGKLSAGHHTFLLDGSALPSGVYIYEIRAGAMTAHGKMVKQ